MINQKQILGLDGLLTSLEYAAGAGAIYLSKTGGLVEGNLNITGGLNISGGILASGDTFLISSDSNRGFIELFPEYESEQSGTYIRISNNEDEPVAFVIDVQTGNDILVDFGVDCYLENGNIYAKSGISFDITGKNMFAVDKDYLSFGGNFQTNNILIEEFSFLSESGDRNRIIDSFWTGEAYFKEYDLVLCGGDDAQSIGLTLSEKTGASYMILRTGNPLGLSSVGLTSSYVGGVVYLQITNNGVVGTDSQVWIQGITREYLRDWENRD